VLRQIDILSFCVISEHAFHEIIYHLISMITGLRPNIHLSALEWYGLVRRTFECGKFKT
jgi:hypothetical protein